MEYIYVYRYHEDDEELCKLEFRTIFHEDMNTKFFVTDKYFDYTRSAFLRGRLDVFAKGHNIQELVESITALKLYYLNFKVEYLKSDTHVEYEDTLNLCRSVAAPIDGSVNFKHPDTLFMVTKILDTYYFGIFHHNKEWNRHFEKPHSFSQSLHLKVARTLVNLAFENDVTKKVIDPCCGIGTVVIEGLSMGGNIRGYDISREVSYSARLNVEHYGYDPMLIQRKDIHDLEETSDCMIMDIPYGVYSNTTYEEQVAMLHKASTLTDEIILITHIPFKKEMESFGFTITDKCISHKMQFDRYVYICKK